MILPYEGDLNNNHTKAIAEALYQSGAVFGNSQFMLCINKCVPLVFQDIKRENIDLAEKRREYAGKIIEGCKLNEKLFWDDTEKIIGELLTEDCRNMSPSLKNLDVFAARLAECIYFTDWEADQEIIEFYCKKYKVDESKVKFLSAKGMKLEIKRLLLDKSLTLQDFDNENVDELLNL